MSEPDANPLAEQIADRIREYQRADDAGADDAQADLLHAGDGGGEDLAGCVDGGEGDDCAV